MGICFFLCNPMRVVIQRVRHAAVHIGGREHAAIGQGLLVLAGYEAADTQADVEWVAQKIAGLRVFDDAQKVPNLALAEVGGQVLLISQFTLHAATKKGNRPSYIRAARPEVAIPLYEATIAAMEKILPGSIQTGVFGADMQVELLNDGPITIWIDSKARE